MYVFKWSCAESERVTFWLGILSFFISIFIYRVNSEEGSLVVPLQANFVFAPIMSKGKGNEIKVWNWFPVQIPHKKCHKCNTEKLGSTFTLSLSLSLSYAFSHSLSINLSHLIFACCYNVDVFFLSNLIIVKMAFFFHSIIFPFFFNCMKCDYSDCAWFEPEKA